MLVVEVVVYIQVHQELVDLVAEALLNLMVQVMVFLEPMDLVVVEVLLQL